LSNTEVYVVEGDSDKKAWQEYVQHSEDTHFFHLIDWRDIVEATYGYKPFYLISRQEGKVTGVFPLFLVKSLFLGRTFKSLPFHFLGGPVCESEEVAAIFFARVRELCEEYGARYLEFRSPQKYDGERYGNVTVSKTYTSFVTPLSHDHNKVHSSFKENIRRFIKKSKSAVEVKKVEDLNELRLFYRQYCAGMRDIGIPPHSHLLFDELFRRFAENNGVRVTLAFYQEKPVASLLTLLFKKRILFWWGVRDFRFRSVPSTHALHWESIRWGCENGYEYYDFGMTSPAEESAIAFKSRWGTHPVQVFFYRMGEDSNAEYDYHTHFKTSRMLWKYLPLPLVRWLGPLIARQIG